MLLFFMIDSDYILFAVPVTLNNINEINLILYLNLYIIKVFRYSTTSKMSIGSVYEKAFKGDYNQVKVKIDSDKSLVTEQDSNNRLLIHWAALSGNENLVEYLIDEGSPVDPVDDTNCTPLLLASSAGRFNVVRLLIGKGANVNHKSNRGQTSLLYACSKGHKEVAKLLIECDANINDVDVLGASPLHRAAAQGRTDIVEILLNSSNINLDLIDSTGCTALHFACEEDRDQTASALVKAGACMDIKNKAGKTPLDFCSQKLKTFLINLVK